MESEKLAGILINHSLWLSDPAKGERANLMEANLTGANLDFSSFPLWCGSLGIKTEDTRLLKQLAYHLCSFDCEEVEYQLFRKALLPFANQFHRVEECGELR
jgi:uncharacterized protein YjbI with pentapeptide repeats